MYRRYQPGPRTQPCKQGKPTAGEMERMQKQQPYRMQENNRGKKQSCRIDTPPQKEKKTEKKENPILHLLPPAFYNAETKKVFGMFSAEDLLLVALIFLLLDSKETEDSILVYLLVYVLISDYIDLPF